MKYIKLFEQLVDFKYLNSYDTDIYKNYSPYGDDKKTFFNFSFGTYNVNQSSKDRKKLMDTIFNKTEIPVFLEGGGFGGSIFYTFNSQDIRFNLNLYILDDEYYLIAINGGGEFHLFLLDQLEMVISFFNLIKTDITKIYKDNSNPIILGINYHDLIDKLKSYT